MARRFEPRFDLNIPPGNSSVDTITTPTLTPTTLRLLENCFGVSHVEPMEHQYQAGFVPPPLNSSLTSDSCDSQFDSDGDLSRDASPQNLAINQDNSNSNSSSGLVNKDRVSTDEEVKRKLRRERNKQAAARCRQRRIEYTAKLARETEQLELGNIELKNTLHGLIQQKAHLEQTLKMHNQKCRQVISSS